MCRLLGYASRAAEPVAQSLGRANFDEFTSLARLHADGWGMAWQDSDGGVQAQRSPDGATQDPAYAELSDTALGRSGLVHLRWATDGLAVAPDNTHPFVDGNLALAHNGSISPIPELESLLRPEFRERLVGATDSERYFRFVTQCVHDAGDVDAGVVAAVTDLHAAFPQSSLNAVVVAPGRLIAIHVNAMARGPVDDLRELYPNEVEAPHGHLDRYFTMAVRSDGERVHIVSSGLRAPGWEPLPESAVLIVDTDTLEQRTFGIGGTAAVGQTPVS